MSAVDDFLRTVLRSGLRDREQLQATLRSLPKDRRGDVSSIIDHLIARDALTRFQSYKLQQGITVGLVLGPYQILTPIGRGGMGTVYLALDTRTQQHVALKILPPKVARTEERLRARFQREMELSQKVQHPHLARTIEAGVFKDVHYIAMEYIPGMTLYRLVTSQGPLPIGRVAHLFAEVASALACAHGQGMIHRDLKPSNIMVTPHDHAKILDLGLAFRQGEEVDDVEVIGGRGYIVGSIDYMAPEQTRDPTNVDGRADLYALGCCLYFALCGQPPFGESTLPAKIRSHRHELPQPIRDKNPKVPEAFAALVHRLLEKAPTERYASAAELEDVLKGWRTPAGQTLEMADDAAFKQAVRDVMASWKPREPTPKEIVEDAVLFHIDEEEAKPDAEPMSGSIFRDIDRVQPYVWAVIAVAIGLILMSACLVGLCILSLVAR